MSSWLFGYHGLHKRLGWGIVPGTEKNIVWLLPGVQNLTEPYRTVPHWSVDLPACEVLVKKPENLLESHENERQVARNEPKQACSLEPAAQSQAGGYGELVQNLAGSIIERNAQARKGPAGEQRMRQKGRKALGRALQGLLGE